MEEANYDIATLRQFIRLNLLTGIPDETTILHFRRRIEQHGLALQRFEVVNTGARAHTFRSGAMVYATLIAAARSDKKCGRQSAPEVHQSRKGQQRHFWMKAHIVAEAASALVHSVECTTTNVAEVTQTGQLQRGEERSVCADAGYIGADKCCETRTQRGAWHIAEKRGLIQSLAASDCKQASVAFEHLKARACAIVEHVFRVINRHFGYLKVRYRRLSRNTAQTVTLCALSKLWMARWRLSPLKVELRPKRGKPCQIGRLYGQKREDDPIQLRHAT